MRGHGENDNKSNEQKQYYTTVGKSKGRSVMQNFHNGVKSDLYVSIICFFSDNV